jgi:2-oxoglutarate ferredoxin oxidoreductase subunit alpha
MDAVEIDRGKVVDEETVGEWQDDQGRFKPHALTEDGISPRTFPGTEGGVHMSTGLEHDELGRRTEDTDMRVRQVDKRTRKVETARAREPFEAREFGDPEAGTLVISWGSNEGAMREAMNFLDDRGVDVRFLSVPYVFPRPDLTDAVEAADEVILVECNATGQFADLIEHDTLTRVTRVNKYDGVRFKADELADRITEVLAGDDEKEEATP